MKKGEENWVIVGESVIGAAHVKNGSPCQDSHYYQLLHPDWGIALVADGAGSVKNAHLGSKFMVEQGAELLANMIQKEKWVSKGFLPDEATWKNLAKAMFAHLRQKVETFAHQEKTEAQALSSTLMVLVFSPLGLLISHVGDGRAAYCDAEGQWKALIQPWKGEYANETVFLTSDIWAKEHIDHYLKSRVVQESVQAFALLSDGCEKHSFICNVWDEESQKYHDPNQPFENFFNPLRQNLLNMQKNGLAEKEMKAKWGKFLREGNAKLKNEPDDKTMILGVKI